MSASPQAPFPSPSETLDDIDGSDGLRLLHPRFDIRPDGQLHDLAPSDPVKGPKQKRFVFDALVIRDSIVGKLRAIGRDDIANPIDYCHREASYKRCVGCRHVRTFYNRCENFFCPICAARLARDRRESIKLWSDRIGQPKHLVLTVVSVKEADNDYVRKIKSDFHKLRMQEWAKKGGMDWTVTHIRPDDPNPEPMPGRKRRRGKLSVWRGTADGTRSTPWRGGLWSMDVTLGPAGWHFHLHAIVDSRFIDRARLEREWAKLRNQPEAIVRVYDVRGKDYAAEVCKYACDGVQIGNWPADRIAQFIDALSGERLFGTFGTLYKQRAEWRGDVEAVHADRNVCECGCAQWKFYSESEWQWEQCKSGGAPPPAHRARQAPPMNELFTLPQIGPR
jgi:hypothetical protein